MSCASGQTNRQTNRPTYITLVLSTHNGLSRSEGKNNIKRKPKIPATQCSVDLRRARLRRRLMSHLVGLLMTSRALLTVVRPAF